MAANTTTSKTGSVAANVVTFPINGHQGAVQISMIFLKGNGSTVTIAPVEFLIPDISATAWFKVPAADGSGTTLGGYTINADADGNYLLTLTYVPIGAKKMRLTVAYGSGDTGTLQIDCYPDYN